MPLRLPRWAELVPPYAIGSIAMFWVVQRVAAFQVNCLLNISPHNASGASLGGRLGLPPLFVWLPIAGRSRTIHRLVKPRGLRRLIRHPARE